MRPGFERFSANLARLVSKTVRSRPPALWPDGWLNKYTIPALAQSSDVKHPMNVKERRSVPSPLECQSVRLAQAFGQVRTKARLRGAIPGCGCGRQLAVHARSDSLMHERKL